ncbi:hypothetical protein Cus16_0538 [Curtobacterium sp. ER1/6]|nr:hypothetical protein Cus16_0538 [Curtobacterium sp. ER1/6]
MHVHPVRAHDPTSQLSIDARNVGRCMRTRYPRIVRHRTGRSTRGMSKEARARPTTALGSP